MGTGGFTTGPTGCSTETLLVGMVMLQQKVVKTGSQNWHRATCADNSGEVEKLRRECMGQGRGAKKGHACREVLPLREIKRSSVPQRGLACPVF